MVNEMDFYAAWNGFKVVTALFVLVSVALYLIRFLSTGHIMSLDEYGLFLRGLILYFIK